MQGSQIQSNGPSRANSVDINPFDLGPGGGVQMMFAKLQLMQSRLCKDKANDYMGKIQENQRTQKEDAQYLQKLRNLINAGKKSKLDSETIKFLQSRGISVDSNKEYSKDEMEKFAQQLSAHQEQAGSSTQTLMVYLQDFIGQYNSFLQGANTAISNANQILTELAKGR